MSTFRWRRGERGASAVEFALVLPLLMAFLLGTVELGLYMKDYVSMSSSTRAGARAASSSAGAGPGTCQASANPPPCTPANAPAFAQAAADTMQTAGMAMNAQDIDWVMIYKANDKGFPGGTGLTAIPENCSTNCVKYIWDAGLNGGKFRYASGSWASASVNACLNDAARESVGIILKARHNWMSGLVGGLMGGDKVMYERTVMQFEPLEQDRCKPGTPNAHS